MNKQELVQKIADELHKKLGDPNQQGKASCLSAESACIEAAKIAFDCVIENGPISFYSGAGESYAVIIQKDPVQSASTPKFIDRFNT